MSIRKAQNMAELDEMINSLGTHIKTLTVVGLKEQKYIIKLKYINGLLSLIDCNDATIIPEIRDQIPDSISSTEFGVCWIHGYGTFINQDLILEFIELEYEDCQIPYYHDRLEVLGIWGFKVPTFHLVEKDVLMMTLGSMKDVDMYVKDVIIVPYLKELKLITESPIIFSL